MANTTRKKRRRSPFVRTILRLFFILLLLRMLAAYISNQVSISSRRAELQTLNEQDVYKRQASPSCSTVLISCTYSLDTSEMWTMPDLPSGSATNAPKGFTCLLYTSRCV